VRPTPWRGSMKTVIEKVMKKLENPNSGNQ
jgi:hypothetical protein